MAHTEEWVIVNQLLAALYRLRDFHDGKVVQTITPLSDDHLVRDSAGLEREIARLERAQERMHDGEWWNRGERRAL